MSKQMHLVVNYNVGGGTSPDHWQLVEDPHRFYSIAHYIEIAQRAEEAGVDAIFLPDIASIRDLVPSAPWQVLDPLDALAAIAVHTEKVGLIGTVSTSFHQPYDLARRLASLDHMSKGRAGWNVVTSAAQMVASNFGVELPTHDERYARAGEFVDLAKKWWDSWEDGALVLDRTTGRMVDSSRLHTVEHVGKYFQAQGRLQVPRGPQGHPVLVQAGASPQGIDFAGRCAELVFMLHTDPDAAAQAYEALKVAAGKYGRDRDDLRVIAGFTPIIGATEAEAKEKEAELEGYLSIENALHRLSEGIRIEFSAADLDKLPPTRPQSMDYVDNASHGFAIECWEWLEANPGKTLREIMIKQQTTRGLPKLVGTAEHIADTFEDWLTRGRADGFMISFTHFPGGLEPFLDEVVPILRARGLFREKYEGTTLREHLNLSVPRTSHAE